MKLTDYQPVECACNQCVAMCQRRPCWGTPEDIESLLDHGYAHGLMLDYWAGEPGFDIVAPAIVGSESQRAPFWPVGPCTFLTERNLCALHDGGLKPTEGAVADCKDDQQNGVTLHEQVARTWDTPKGRAVVHRWRKEVGL